MPLPLLAALLLAPSSAVADDLQLELTLFSPDREYSRAITYHDIEDGPQPGLTVTTPDGERYRVDLDVTLLGPDDPERSVQVRYDVQLFEIETLRNGRGLAEVISRLRMVGVPNEPASVQQGTRMEDGEGGYVTASGFRIELLYLASQLD